MVNTLQCPPFSPFTTHRALASGNMGALSNAWPPRGALGVWSWNPNLWGMTPEEANQYEKDQAANEIAVAKMAAEREQVLAQGAAAVETANPSLLGTFKGATIGLTNSVTVLTVLTGVAVLGLGTAWAYNKFVDSGHSKKR